MKPSELYTRTPESVSNDLNELRGTYYNHIPEINEDRCYYFDNEIIEKNVEVEIKILKHFNYDSRRYWRLATVWFCGNPVMITRNAGREGDDHYSRFITNEVLYRQMIEYINSLLPPNFIAINDIVDENKDIKNLETFYEGTLDGYFERYKH